MCISRTYYVIVFGLLLLSCSSFGQKLIRSRISYNAISPSISQKQILQSKVPTITIRQSNHINYSQKNLIKVYPNPTSSYFMVNFVGSEHQRFTCSIYDIAGRKVMSFGENKIQESIESFKYDLSQINAGVYFVEIYLSNEKQQSRYSIPLVLQK